MTDAQIQEYYAKNKAQYSQPQSRDVRHILVKTKKQADDLYAQLQDGANFAALAKQFSEDTGSKANGGKLTISKGQTVAPFDQTAFLREEERHLEAGQDRVRLPHHPAAERDEGGEGTP